MNKVIAIDGPAVSGKGTVAKLISEKLGYVYIDTGATYRCVALKMIQNGIKLEEKEKIEKIASNIDIVFTKDAKVYLDGNDVTDEIRSKEVTDIVSQVSSNVKVREYMVELQRKMAGDNDVVMEGRELQLYSQMQIINFILMQMFLKEQKEEIKKIEKKEL